MLVSHPEHEEYYLDRYREREVRRTGKKVRRSQSDVTLHSTRRPKNRKQRKETPFEKEKSTRSHDSEDRSSNERYEQRPRRSQSNEREIERTIVADIHRQKKPAPPPPKPKPHKQDSQIKSMDFSDAEISESATDSAKLRALERERERNREAELAAERKKNQENIRHNGYSGDNRGFVDDNGYTNDLNVRPYSYEGKPASKYESSIVAKMAAMTETPKATYINRQTFVDSSSKANEIPNPPSKEAFHAEVSKKLEKLQDRTVPPLDLTEGPVATSTGNHSRASRPTSAKRRSRRGSNVTDQDGEEQISY